MEPVGLVLVARARGRRGTIGGGGQNGLGVRGKSRGRRRRIGNLGVGLAIIGSANINERSQRGDRDSEIAAVIRDTDMIDW